MTTTAKRQSRRHVDVVSLVVMAIGVLFAVVSYCLISFADVNVLVIVPSIVAITLGATHLIKHEAPHE
ncbi:MAG: hypothetical protein U5O16_14555 [Rhodococcus sp. (in: high G+C Gram-positive bacteria)]|uniref:hypothetical protein n=1 Tax=Rhodococcus sp. TaxID=1831 RepID=UPI002AD69AC7|nr:hypothetical protein [Rhodococcus sp. (in: high G+C Gram-positive bacteria)]MDZ7913033.1 hypothetical protein [Rhodococcus sp. (in: high G+C Gram-positive bacteria)]